MTDERERDLASLGLNQEQADALSSIAEGEGGRVVRSHRNSVRLWTKSGELEVAVPARLHRQNRSPVVGDWVAFSGNTGAEAVVDVLPRKSSLSRAAAGRASEIQVVATNIDTVFVVAGLDADFNIRRLERMVTQVFSGGSTPVVVLNKADLVDDSTSYRAEVEAALPGVDVVIISALGEPGVEALDRYLTPATTVVLLGSSGVGKSSITNELLHRDVQAVGAVRESDLRGKHTTSHRELFALENGALIIDTPGLREVKLDADEDDLDATFSDIATLAESCRFRDCRHDGEPGCAVVAAIDSGDLARDRFDSYDKLRTEIADTQIRMAEHERRAKDKRFATHVRRTLKHSRRLKGDD